LFRISIFEFLIIKSTSPISSSSARDLGKISPFGRMSLRAISDLAR
jgi:hypothetical protein